MPAFPEIDRIPFEGPDSRNSLAYRYYDADEVSDCKSMRDHLRFSVVYWHTFRGQGADPFGPGTALRVASVKLRTLFLGSPARRGGPTKNGNFLSSGGVIARG